MRLIFVLKQRKKNRRGKEERGEGRKREHEKEIGGEKRKKYGSKE
jgi:hypothetical protein